MKIGLNHDRTTLIDEDDADLAGALDWRFQGNGYATTHLYLHRLVLERVIGRPLKPGEECDHVNGNKLDNRRANLRLANSSQNKANRAKKQSRATSSFIGVSWDSKRQKWTSGIGVNGRYVFIGRFDDEVEAARMRDAYAIAHHRQFARLNFTFLGFGV